MEIKDIYTKLEKMSEQITKLRETAARTEAHLDSLVYLKSQVEQLTETRNQWKGATIAISAIFSVIASIIARMLLK